MMQVSFFDLYPNLLEKNKSEKDPSLFNNEEIPLKKARVGRPTKEEAAAKMRVKIYPVPEINEQIFIEQRVLDRYRPKRQWCGKVLDKTSNCILVQLKNGIRECFQIKEFKYGLLSYKKIV